MLYFNTNVGATLLSSNGTKTLCFRVVPGQLQLLNCVSRVL